MEGGFTGFSECMWRCGDSGAIGDNGSSETGDCLGSSDWSVVGFSFSRDLLDSNTCSLPASEMLAEDLLLCGVWERPECECVESGRDKERLFSRRDID
jgi:hypothetical protein